MRLQLQLSQFDKQNRANPVIWDVPSEGEDRVDSEASRGEGSDNGVGEQAVSLSIINRNSRNEILDLPTPTSRRRTYSARQESRQESRSAKRQRQY